MQRFLNSLSTRYFHFLKGSSHSCLAEKYIIGEINDIYVKNMPFFFVFLGGAEGAKFFLGLTNRFSTNPEKNVKVRKIAPSKIGFL